MALYLIYRFIKALALLLPIKFGYSLAAGIAILQYSISGRDRRAVISNLKAVLGADDIRLLRKYSREVFVNFAKYLVDFFRFSRLDKDAIGRTITIRNRHYLDEALQKGSGVIALTGHIGNWELAGVVTSLLGYPLSVIALSHKHRRVNELFIRQRQIKGVKVVPLGAAVKRCFTALKNNEMIGLLGDRDFTRGGIRMKFFGRETTVPRGPASFCLKSKAAIIPSFMIRQPDDTFVYTFEPPIEAVSTGCKEKDIRDITRKAVDVIEKYIRLYPTQWFMFRRFWEEDANVVA